MDAPRQPMDDAPRDEDRFGLILDAMVDAVFVTDAAGRVVHHNEAFERLAEADVRDRPVGELIESPALRAAVQRASEGAAVDELEIELLRDGRKRWVTAQLTALPSGDGSVVAVLHDITQLKATDKVRRDFVANASHELRTPLTAIVGFAETLQDGAVDDPETARRFLANITANTRRLMSVVEDLLVLSRAESPESALERRPVDVVCAAAKVIEGLEANATEKGQTLVLLPDPDTPIEALCDPHALDQILVNLVDNAIKYTPRGGRIEVDAAREGDRLRIDVRDSGPGIKAKYLDRIFQRFYRVDKGRSRDQGGTGLGLSIVKHLVNRIDGEISVRSAEGEGSVFTVRLPVP